MATQAPLLSVIYNKMKPFILGCLLYSPRPVTFLCSPHGRQNSFCRRALTQILMVGLTPTKPVPEHNVLAQPTSPRQHSIR